MDREQAVKYLQSSGFSEEQIKAIEGAFSCEDAISRQAVLDLLENTNNGWIINKVLQLPSVTPRQKWIPVSERLPEKSTWVLVTCKNPDGYIFLDIKLINRYTELWDGDEDFIGTVLAWMPLPEPYKKEGGEKE